MSALPAERAGPSAPADILATRAAMAGAVAAGTWATDPGAVACTVGGRRALRWRDAQRPRARVLHFHGGGYRIGCPEQSGPYAAALVRGCGVEVVAPCYRLAPEHPFPAGLNDAAAVLRALLAEGDAPVFLSGDSAGGGLAAGLAVLARREGATLAGLVLHSPWLDLTVTAPAYAGNAATDPLFSRASAALAADLYLAGHAADDPLASPLFADAGDFPPTFVSVGTGEVLVDDATRLCARIATAGGDARLLRVPEMTHTAVVRDQGLPGAAETLAATVAFINARLAA